jgi:xylulokinase
MYLLGIDLGTTGCKSMVFDVNGNILGEHYIEYDLIFTSEGVEQNANLWWENIKIAIKNALREANIDGKKVLSLSISSQGISFVPVDKNGDTLMNAISWYDSRAIEEAAIIRKDYDNFKLFSRTGRQITSLVFPQVMWIKKHRPEIYEKAFKFLMGLDFLLYRFSGQYATDYSMASGTLCYDVINREWIPEFFEKYNIDINKFPNIYCFGDVVGTVLPEVAQELGLSTDTKVVMGLQDQKTAAVGAGIDDGVITLSMGTASAICSITNKHLVDPTMKTACHGFDRQRWIMENCVGTSGAALKWVRTTMFPYMSYKEMDELAETAPAGSNDVFFNPQLYKQGLGGNKGAFRGIGLEITQGDIIRSVLEGIAYGIKECIDAHKDINESVAATEQVRIFGGGANSPIWCQIIADITGMRILVPRTHETGNLGAAICAGIGAGVFKDLKDAQRIVGEPQKEYIPKKENKEIYKKGFNKYLEIRRSC